MSDPENFLTRWSRRKRNVTEETPAASEAAQEKTCAAPAETKESEAFDPASLPPIESLEPGSDIRPFLQKNVPADLTRAALRRAWSADQAIRDFVGLSENAWDFNAPDTIPGFGPLEMTDEMRRMVAEIFSEQPEAATKVAAVAAPQPAEPVQIAEGKDISQETAATTSEDDSGASGESSGGESAAASGAAFDTAQQPENVATQQNGPPESADRPAPRGHGRALPQ